VCPEKGQTSINLGFPHLQKPKPPIGSSQPAAFAVSKPAAFAVSKPAASTVI
jgi:hypothetical protein